VEAEILPATRELGIGFVAHTPLGKGLLTGTLTSPAQLHPGDIRRNHPRFQEPNFERNRELVAEAENAVSSAGIPLPQLALAWLLSRGTDIVPIPGTRRSAHLMTNLAAAGVPISTALADRLAALVSPDRVAGPRLPVRR
jgi:aryl-alcohol dehydrogenase-like predicted oxidoreductase